MVVVFLSIKYLAKFWFEPNKYAVPFYKVVKTINKNVKQLV